MHGPTASDDCLWATQGLPEEEEESAGSEDEGGGTVCEDGQNIGSKNGTHIEATLFDNLLHWILMESAGLSHITSKNSTYMEATLFEDLQH